MSKLLSALTICGTAALFCLAGSLPVCHAAPDNAQADALFQKGIDKYLAGDIPAAVKELEKVIEINPKHEQARSLLSIVLGETASSYFIQGDYGRAMPYLQKLRKIFPEDNEIRRMYDQASKGMSSVQRSEDMVRFLQKQQRILSTQKPSQPTPAVKPAETTSARPVKSIPPVAAPLSVEPTPAVSTESVAAKVDDEVNRRLLALREEMERKQQEIVSKAQSQMSIERREFMRKTFFWAGGFSAGVAVLFGGFALLLKHQTRKERKHLTEGIEKVVRHFRSEELEKIAAEPEPLNPAPISSKVEVPELISEIEEPASIALAPNAEPEPIPEPEPELEPEPAAPPVPPVEEKTAAPILRTQIPEAVFEPTPAFSAPTRVQSSQPELKPILFNDEKINQTYDTACRDLEKIFRMVQKWDLSFSQSALSIVDGINTLMKDPVRGHSLVAKAMSPYSDANKFYFAHCINVTILCCYLKQNELPRRLQEVGIAALLHDIGVAEKLSIISENREFDDPEKEMLKLHRKSGAWILKNIEAEKESFAPIRHKVAQIVQSTHDLAVMLDFYDVQKGVPDEIESDPHADPTIREIALLIGLMEVFEALTHDRPYRRAHSPSGALNVMTKNLRKSPIIDHYVELIRLKFCPAQEPVGAA